MDNGGKIKITKLYEIETIFSVTIENISKYDYFIYHFHLKGLASNFKKIIYLFQSSRMKRERYPCKSIAVPTIIEDVEEEGLAWTTPLHLECWYWSWSSVISNRSQWWTIIRTRNITWSMKSSTRRRLTRRKSCSSIPVILNIHPTSQY